MGDRIAILGEGGRLAQYDTPDAILARPADAFVERFIGDDRALRRLALYRLSDLDGLDPDTGSGLTPDVAREDTGSGLTPDVAGQDTVSGQTRDMPAADPSTTVRNAVSLMLDAGADRLRVVGADGQSRGVLTLARAMELLQR
jgi:osmoprotectant transport system ATP-binding protein